MGNKNSGRRPQPTALKVLRGNPGQRKLNTAEPVPPAGDVTKPIQLSPGASALWDECAPIALAMRTLTPADVWAFARLCELQASSNRASIDKQSTDPDVAAKGYQREMALAPQIRPFYAMFGLEPSARARLTVPKPADAGAEPSRKWAGVLK